MVRCRETLSRSSRVRYFWYLPGLSRPQNEWRIRPGINIVFRFGRFRPIHSWRLKDTQAETCFRQSDPRLGRSLPPLGKHPVSVWRSESDPDERVSRQVAQKSPAQTCRCRAGIQFVVSFGRVTPHSARITSPFILSQKPEDSSRMESQTRANSEVWRHGLVGGPHNYQERRIYVTKH